MSKKIFLFLLIILITVSLWIYFSNTKGDSSYSPDVLSQASDPVSPESLSKKLASSPSNISNQNKKNNLKPRPTIPSGSNQGVSKEDKIDPAFDSWLQNYGLDLDPLDFTGYMQSDLNPSSKLRLLEYWYFENPNGYDYLNSKNGIEFLNTLLRDNPKNFKLGEQIGFIFYSYNKFNDDELSASAEERFLQSNNETEKIALIRSITDEKILRNAVYNHKENTLVRGAAAQNFLMINKDSSTLKDLLELSDAEPTLQKMIVSGAVTAANTPEELETVINIFKNVGLGIDSIAEIIGQTLAYLTRQDLVKNLDLKNDNFKTKIVYAYRIKIDSDFK